MINIGKWAIHNRLLIYFLVGVLVVGGAFTCYKMSKLEDPQIKVKMAMVVTTYPGASAHQVELEVTDVLEKRIRTMGDLDNVESYSYADLSIIMVELRSTVNPNQVEQCWDRLRRKVYDAQADLPAGASVSVTKEDFSDVYGIFYALTGDGLSESELGDYAELIKREVANMEGINRVEIYGKQRECIHIRMLQDRMSSLGVVPTEVLATLNGQNKTSYAGYYDNGDQRVRVTVTDRFQTVDDFNRMIIQGHENDQLRLSDIAVVEKAIERPVRNALTYDGEPALGLLISVSSQADIVKVGAAVEQRLADLRATRLPTGVECHKVFYQPDRVTHALGDFVINLIESVGIVVFVLMLFMGWRSGLIIGVSLVVIVFGSFLVLGRMDGTMQRISLGTFILAMGMLVDNAIVIIDGVLVDKQAGKPRLEALTDIGCRTGLPLLGATLIAILSFLPIFLSPDTAGVYVRDLFIVMAVSLLLSWVLALTHVPLMAGQLLVRGKCAPQSSQAQGGGVVSRRATALLRSLLHACLRHRWTVTIVMLLLLLAAVVGYKHMHHGFFPDMVYDQCYIEYKLPEGANSTQVRKDLQQIEAYLHTRPEVKHVTASLGGTPGRYNLVRTVALPSLAYGELIVDFESPKALDRSIDEIQQYLLHNYPGAYAKIKKYNLMFKKYPIELQFQGPDPAVLHRLAEEARAVIEQTGQAYLLTTDWEPKVPILSVDYNQPAARKSGFSRSDLSLSLMMACGGLPIGSFYDGIDRNNIYIKCVDQNGQPIEDLRDLQVFSALPSLSGVLSEENLIRYKTGSLSKEQLLESVLGTIPMRQVARDISVEWEDPVVPRYNGQRMQRVQCTPCPGLETEKTRAALARAIDQQITLPEGYSMCWMGEKAASDRSIKYLFQNFPMAIILMIAILILLFKDWRKPTIIFCTIPMVFVGVVLTMLATGMTFTFCAIVGALGLIGMIVKNGIVLMDEINLQIASGVEPVKALVDSSQSRLRPVMMASLTTILGMIPLLSDAMFGSMAVTIMGGLFFGTIITLLFIPVLYALFFGIRDRKPASTSVSVSESRSASTSKSVSTPIVLLLLCLPLGVRAQSESALTVDCCRQMALQHNKEKQRAALTTQAARYTMRSTRALFFPDVSLLGAAAYATTNDALQIEGGLLPVGAINPALGQFVPNGQMAYFPGLTLDYKLRDVYTAALVLKQPLYMGGKITAGYRKSRLAVDLYRQAERKTEAEVIQQVDEAYAKVVKARELLQVAERYRSLLQELDKNIESAVRHGMRMEADRMKVQVRMSEVELQIRRAQNGVRLATMNLCHAIGCPLNTPIEVSAQYPAVDDALALSTLNVELRPEYQMLTLQSELAEQDVRMARSEMRPQLALLAKYGYTYGLQVNHRPMLDGFGFAAGVTLNVPLYHFGERSNKLRAAKAKQQAAQLERESKSELMMLELAQAANNLDEARLEVSLAEQTQASAFTSMQVSKKQFDAGVEPLSNYLEAQAVWQNAYEAQIDAHFQLFLSSVNYLRAAGLLVQ